MALPKPGPAFQRPRRRLLRGAAAALALAATGRVHARGGPAPRIAHVMSFDTPWRSTDGQLEGFREALGLPAAEIGVFQMDTKRHASDEDKAERGRQARPTSPACSNVNTWPKPCACCASWCQACAVCR